METLTVAGVRQYNPPGLQPFWFGPPIFAPFQPTILSAPINTRAGSLNHFSGEPGRGAPNFSQSQRGIS